MKTVLLIVLSLTIGIILGEHHRGKGPFFVSWFGNELYYGQKIKLDTDDELSGWGWKHFFSNCTGPLTIAGFSEGSDDVWIRVDDCYWHTENGPMFHTFKRKEIKGADK